MRKVATTIGLLLISNAFMNAAWYGHLKFKTAILPIAIFASWGIAFFEYCFQVPANRIGSGVMSVTQLKITQEVLSLATFAIFASLFLGEKLQWNHAVSFVLIILACWFAFLKV
ncbi:MAG: DMT family protein [Fimbriimonas sp.]